MFLYPIPDRSKDITSINVMEFLLRKQAHMIFSHTVGGIIVLCVNIDDWKNKHHIWIGKVIRYVIL